MNNSIDEVTRRWMTFKNFPINNDVGERQLAESGFIYPGAGNEVYCEKCRKCVSIQQIGEHPMEIHKRISPDCPFVLHVEHNGLIRISGENGASNVADDVDRGRFSQHRCVEPTESSSISPIIHGRSLLNEHPPDFLSNNEGFLSNSSLVSGNPVCQPTEDTSEEVVLLPYNSNHSSQGCSSWQNGLSNPMETVSPPLSSHEENRKPVLLEEGHLSTGHEPSISNGMHHMHISNNWQNSTQYTVTHPQSHAQESLQFQIPSQVNTNEPHRTSGINPLQSPEDSYSGVYNVNRQSNIQISNNVHNFQQVSQIPLIPNSQPLNMNNQHSQQPQQSQITTLSNNQPLNITGNEQNAQSQQTQMESNQRLTVTSNNDVYRLINDRTHGQNEWLNPRTSTPNPHTAADYTVKANRLQSFNGRWPAGYFLQPEELADAGLYYTGPGDRCQCAWCRGGLLNWEAGDTALGEHQRHFPQCHFVRQKVASLLSGRGFQSNFQTTSPEVPWPIPYNYQQNGPIYSEVTRTPPPQRHNSFIPPYQSQPAPFSMSTEDNAIKTAKDMGYGMDIINKSLIRMRTTHPGINITANDLLECIFEIESEESGPSDVLPAEQMPVNFQTNHVSTRDIEPPTANITSAESNSSLLGESDKSLQLTKLREENKRLKAETTCKVCLEKSVQVLFLPCRHLVCCEECADKVKTCPYCRTDIVGTVKTYIP